MAVGDRSSAHPRATSSVAERILGVKHGLSSCHGGGVDRLAVLVFGSRCLVVQSLGEFLEFVGPRLVLAAEPERDSRVW